jgi:hypothetical protein
MTSSNIFLKQARATAVLRKRDDGPCALRWYPRPLCHPAMELRKIMRIRRTIILPQRRQPTPGRRYTLRV